MSNYRNALTECDQGAYLPTAEEITEATRKIREGWSEEKENKRLRSDHRVKEFVLADFHLNMIGHVVRSNPND